MFAHSKLREPQRQARPNIYELSKEKKILGL